jgi:hypothetical protein
MSLKPKKTGAVRPNSSWEAPWTEFIKMDVNAAFHEETRNGQITRFPYWYFD